MMMRRKFLIQMGAALACSQLPVWATDTTLPTPAIEAKKHFDLYLARKIKEEFLATEQAQRSISQYPNLDIDLSEYSSASLDALECLAPLNGSFSFIGFESITPEMAKVLSGWATYGLMFSQVQYLCHVAATCLGSEERGHLLAFDSPMKLDALAAEALVCNGTMLDLRLQSAPDLRLAKALATHQHELTLKLPCNIVSPPVAEALSFHAGSHLNLWMPERPSELILQTFAENGSKRLGVVSPQELNEPYRVASALPRQENWLISLVENRGGPSSLVVAGES